MFDTFFLFLVSLYPFFAWAVINTLKSIGQRSNRKKVLYFFNFFFQNNSPKQECKRKKIKRNSNS